MDSFYVYNFSVNSHIYFKSGVTPFVLSTCQRKLFVSSTSLNFSNNQKVKELKNEEAYKFLLNVISGLESKLIAESEIVSQFKKAFSDYLSKKNRDSKIIKIIETLFKDSKEIRTRYLNGIAQRTYSSIVRTKILKDNPEKILIIGSGKMSKELINQLKGKVDLCICARNTSELNKLEKESGIKPIEWLDYDSIQNFSHIINTIGSDKVIFDSDFLNNWNKKAGLFIDIGSPSSLEFNQNNRKNIILLEDIFKEGILKEKDKVVKINKAKKHIGHLSQKKFNYSKKYDFCHLV